jgi:hypothetical protein
VNDPLDATLAANLGEEEQEEPRKKAGRKRDRENNEEHRKMRLSKEQSQQLEAAFKEDSTHSPVRWQTGSRPFCRRM